MLVTVTFAWTFSLNRSSLGSSKRSSGALSALWLLSPASFVGSNATLGGKVGTEGVESQLDPTRGARSNSPNRAAADLRCGRMAVMAWSCRKRRWLR